MTALILLTMTAATLGIPSVLFPILKEHNGDSARGYAVARIFEAVPIIAAWLVVKGFDMTAISAPSAEGAQART